jgi:hypothetical protein
MLEIKDINFCILALLSLQHCEAIMTSHEPDYSSVLITGCREMPGKFLPHCSSDLHVYLLMSGNLLRFFSHYSVEIGSSELGQYSRALIIVSSLYCLMYSVLQATVTYILSSFLQVVKHVYSLLVFPCYLH